MERDSMDRKVKKMRAFQGEKDGQNRNLSSALCNRSIYGGSEGKTGKAERERERGAQ